MSAAAMLRLEPSRWAFRAMLAVALCTAALPAQTGTKGSYGFTVMRDVMLPMRDGVRLATDVYLPADANGQAIPGRFPVILTRTPYDKGMGWPDGPEPYFTSHGYVVVAQDLRGRFRSEGKWDWLVDDGRDGQDTCNWIGKQPWSNGRIGMFGTSYVGGTQHALALQGCEYLKTVIPVDAMSNFTYQSVRNGGAFELRFWNWILTNLEGSAEARDPHVSASLYELQSNRMAYLPHLPLREGTTPLHLVPEYEHWLVRAMQQKLEDPFWGLNAIIDSSYKYQDMPVYLVGGWYDSWAGNTSRNYQVLSKRLKSPVYLIFGPWTHGGQTSSSHGQVDFGKDAAIADQWAWRTAWFNRWLKEQPDALGRYPTFGTRVRIFVMGTGGGAKGSDGLLQHGGYWRDENEWPLARVRTTDFYLQNGGGLTTTPPRESKSSTSYQFDPKNPVPNIGGNLSSAAGVALAGAWNQKGGPHVWNMPQPIPLSARNDVLVFQTEPLAEDVEVTGEISVTLYASSDALDTDFTAKLLDVYPQSADWPAGFDLNLEDGIIRARFRDDLKVQKLMTPGEIYQFTIKLYPTSNVFKKGHRIRVDISSSNYPRFDVNPNTGEPLNDNRQWKVATNTIYHDAAHPSHIVLPLIPKGSR